MLRVFIVKKSTLFRIISSDFLTLKLVQEKLSIRWQVVFMMDARRSEEWVLGGLDISCSLDDGCQVDIRYSENLSPSIANQRFIWRFDV